MTADANTDILALLTAGRGRRLLHETAMVGETDGRGRPAEMLVRPVREGDLDAILALVGRGGTGLTSLQPDRAAQSRAVGRLKQQHLLDLADDFDGEVEVGRLFADPERRGLALGRLLARHRGWFARRVRTELRGCQDNLGHSPVWEAIGPHFYDMDFRDADRTGAIHGNQVIADLGPRHPLYLSLLPPDARAALGRPHDDGRPARDRLLAEGFRDESYVDIFDGGPTPVADIDAVRTVREAAVAPVVAVAADADRPAIASAGEGAAFRCAFGGLRADEAGVTLSPALAATLGVARGEPVCHAPA